MIGFFCFIGLVVVFVVAVRVSSAYEIRHGLINLRKDNSDETTEIPLSHVRSGPSGSPEDACCSDRILLGANA